MMSQVPYCGPAPTTDSLFGAWNTDPLLLVALALLALAGVGAAHRPAFALGWLALVVAFVSPLCALTVALFAARAVHHLLLLTVAAPLLALAFPRVLAWLPLQAALLLVITSLVLWHVPAVYSAAWGSGAVYWAMQLGLILPAVALWGQVIRRARAGLVLGPLGAIAALTGVMGLIGAVLTFAPEVLYPDHGLAPMSWGLLPLQDQQLAGLLMWVPGLLPLAVIAGLLLRRAWDDANRGGAAA